MNVFDQLMSAPRQRPGDPRDVMSYAEAMALRDRARAGQPVDKDKLAEAGRIVNATRERLGGYEPAPVQEQLESAGAAQSGRADLPPELVKELSRPARAALASGQCAGAYEPKPGSIAWKVLSYLKRHPEKIMTRVELGDGFGFDPIAVDGFLKSAVNHGGVVKEHTDRGVCWRLGSVDAFNLLVWEGHEDEVIELAQLEPKPERAPRPPAGKAEAKKDAIRADIRADMEPHTDRANRVLLDKLQGRLPRWVPGEPEAAPAREEPRAPAPAAAPEPAPSAAPAPVKASIPEAAGADRMRVLADSLEWLRAEEFALVGQIAAMKAKAEDLKRAADAIECLLHPERAPA